MLLMPLQTVTNRYDANKPNHSEHPDVEEVLPTNGLVLAIQLG